jgi:hypothetical protein
MIFWKDGEPLCSSGPATHVLVSFIPESCADDAVRLDGDNMRIWIPRVTVYPEVVRQRVETAIREYGSGAGGRQGP